MGRPGTSGKNKYILDVRKHMLTNIYDFRLIDS